MNLLTASKTLFLAFGLMLVSITSQAGQKDFGEYQVHWSVLPSTFLAPEVAQANNKFISNSNKVKDAAVNMKIACHRHPPQSMVTNTLRCLPLTNVRWGMIILGEPTH